MKSIHSKLEANGRIVVPAEYRKALGLKAGDSVVITLDEDSMRLRPLARELDVTRAYLRQFGPEGELWSESLIRDRRTEAQDE